MRRVKTYTLEREQFEQPFIFYRSRHGQHIVGVSAENRDKIEVFKEAGFTYVLYWNRRSRRIGIERFLGSDSTGNLKLQGHETIRAALGNQGLKLSPTNMAKKLCRYLVAIPRPSPLAEPEGRRFEIYLKDLTDEARQRYLARIGKEPVYGPIAILEVARREDS